MFYKRELAALYLTASMELHVFKFKDYFQRLHHNALNTRNNGKTAKLPKVKLDFACCSFYFLGASIFNSLPLSLRNINSRVLFRRALDDYYL